MQHDRNYMRITIKKNQESRFNNKIFKEYSSVYSEVKKNKIVLECYFLVLKINILGIHIRDIGWLEKSYCYYVYNKHTKVQTITLNEFN